MPPHSFAVGQNVELLQSRFGASAPAGGYTILRLLPNDDADREYRVRNLQDGHERVVRESQMRRGGADAAAFR